MELYVYGHREPLPTCQTRRKSRSVPARLPKGPLREALGLELSEVACSQGMSMNGPNRTVFEPSEDPAAV